MMPTISKPVSVFQVVSVYIGKLLYFLPTGDLMALPFQKSREIIFLLLYRGDFAPSDLEGTIALIMENLKVTKRSVLDAQLQVASIQEKLIEIDEKIRAASTEYSFERISSVEKTVLRLGLYELLYRPDVAPKIVFSEAIRLTRKFSSPEGAQFVNAVLDKVYQNDLSLSSTVAEESAPL